MGKKNNNNQIFQGFGTGSGVSGGSTSGVTTQITLASPTKSTTTNPYSATSSASTTSNPYTTSTTNTSGWTSGNRTCSKNSDCPSGKVCVNGACWDTTPSGGGASCTSNAQCGQGKVCVNYQCVTPPSGGGTTPTNPCVPNPCPSGQTCVGNGSMGGYRCLGTSPRPTDPINGSPPPGNVCSASSPQGACPPGQLCDNGVCRALPANKITGKTSNENPEEYYRYLVNRGGMHMRSDNALGAFAADQYDNIYKDYKAAWLQNPALNWNDFLTMTFGPEQMVADYLRRKFLGSSAAQQGFNPSQYGSGPARWSVF